MIGIGREKNLWHLGKSNKRRDGRRPWRDIRSFERVYNQCDDKKKMWASEDESIEITRMLDAWELLKN